jgi:hypothetical protein
MVSRAIKAKKGASKVAFPKIATNQLAMSSASVTPGTIVPVQHPERITREGCPRLLYEQSQAFRIQARRSKKDSEACLSSYLGGDKYRKESEMYMAMAQHNEAILSCVDGRMDALTEADRVKAITAALDEAEEARARASSKVAFGTDRNCFTEEDRLTYAAVCLVKNPEADSVFVNRKSKDPQHYWNTSKSKSICVPRYSN